ncbi:conserved hypothetical protein [Neospora caninum Liverpool]|uniref:Uncharacterized protein n=1 Tax=Neospora caninum (strain Liverpool) TaxID=572307 RepID=F0VBG6_NEOCL|nr:conserved hypothetical protein [Neospora caninum Liverpool]CBZ50950.1 conserved hypothetical protein [Neospora caninum Liverpool]CEL68251.1 TPA: hypothetical protein BN1204_040250 [Neospora caninum Liverpool]|eukprot:XP_003880983.1 conserved hypothetical protein [Neospora caninum Liverpool]
MEPPGLKKRGGRGHREDRRRRDTSSEDEETSAEEEGRKIRQRLRKSKNKARVRRPSGSRTAEQASGDQEETETEHENEGEQDEEQWATNKSGEAEAVPERHDRSAAQEREKEDRTPWLLVRLSRLVARPSVLLGVQDALDAQLAALYELRCARLEAEIARRQPPEGADSAEGAEVDSQKRKEPIVAQKGDASRPQPSTANPRAASQYTRQLVDRSSGACRPCAPSAFQSGRENQEGKARTTAWSTRRGDVASLCVSPGFSFSFNPADLPWNWCLSRSPWDFSELSDEALYYLHDVAKRAAWCPPFAEAWTLCVRATLHFRDSESSQESPPVRFACSVASPGLQGCSAPVELRHVLFSSAASEGDQTFFGSVSSRATGAKEASALQKAKDLMAWRGVRGESGGMHFARGCAGLEANAGGSVYESAIAIPGMRSRVLRVQASLLDAAANLRSEERKKFNFLDAAAGKTASESVESEEQSANSDEPDLAKDSVDAPVPVPCSFGPLLLRPTETVPEWRRRHIPSDERGKTPSGESPVSRPRRQEFSWIAEFPKPPGKELVLVLNVYASCVARLPSAREGECVPKPVHVACTVIPFGNRTVCDRQMVPFCEPLRVPFSLPVFLNVRRLQFVRCVAAGAWFRISEAICEGGQRPRKKAESEEGCDAPAAGDAHCDGGFLGGVWASGRGRAPQFSVDGAATPARIGDEASPERERKETEPKPAVDLEKRESSGDLWRYESGGGDGELPFNTDDAEEVPSPHFVDPAQTAKRDKKTERKRRRRRDAQLRKLLKKKLGDAALSLFGSTDASSSEDEDRSWDSCDLGPRRRRGRGRPDWGSSRSLSDALFDGSDSESSSPPWSPDGGRRRESRNVPRGGRRPRQGSTRNCRLTEGRVRETREIEEPTDVEEPAELDGPAEKTPGSEETPFADGSATPPPHGSQREIWQPEVSPLLAQQEEERMREDERRRQPLVLCVESYLDENGQFVFNRREQGREAAARQGLGGSSAVARREGRPPETREALRATATAVGLQDENFTRFALGQEEKQPRLLRPERMPPGYDTAETNICMRLDKLARVHGWTEQGERGAGARVRARAAQSAGREKRLAPLGENEGRAQPQGRTHFGLSSSLPLLEVEWKGMRRSVASDGESGFGCGASGGDRDGEGREVDRNRFLAPLYLEAHSWQSQQRLLEVLEETQAKVTQLSQAPRSRLDRTSVSLRLRGAEREAKKPEKGDSDNMREELRKVQVRMRRHKPSLPPPRQLHASLRAKLRQDSVLVVHATAPLSPS